MAKTEKKKSGFETRVIKLESAGKPAALAAVVQSNQRELEDEFQGLYEGVNGVDANFALIKPPYDFWRLEDLVFQNNALGPCVDAMVANIDGTGFSLNFDGKPEAELQEADKAILDRIKEFFDEPFPGMSFTTMRARLRRDLEVTGNAYLEVLRNATGELVFVRPVEAKTVRLVRLDNPSVVDVKVQRNGVEMSVKVMMRERRYCQRINNIAVYFKDFGASRDLNKNSGSWADAKSLPADQRATEIIHFTLDKDVLTPYGVPRWISQLPSVLGSREAEEHNLSYFESGGIPPIMMLVQGGAMAPEAVKALNDLFSGKAKSKQRAAVIEAHSTSGSLDAANNVRVTVERFGSERQQDSMFEGYGEKCEARIRGSFRLPPLFVGKAGDYSFATAFASYTVAEAQVFDPERREFDEQINMKLMRELVPAGKGKVVFRSNPLAVKDATQQLTAVQAAKAASAIDGEQFVDLMNQIVNLQMTFSQEAEDKAAEAAAAAPAFMAAQVDENGNPVGKPATAKKPTETPEGEPTPGGNPSTKKVAKSAEGIVALGQELSGLLRQGKDADRTMLQKALQDAASLSDGEVKMLKTVLAVQSYSDPENDVEGLGEIAGCALAIMASNSRH